MNTRDALKFFSIIGNKVTNLTQKESKSLEDSANTYRKTNGFKVYKNDNVETLNNRFELNLSQDILSLLATKSNVTYTLFLIMFTIKRIQSTNRPPIKIDGISLEEFNNLKKYLISLQQ